MNVAIACGGTGGHLFPGLAVAEALRARGHRTLVFISEKEIDSLATRNQTGSQDFRLEKLRSIGMPRLFSLAAFGFVRGMMASILDCRQIYRSFHPDAVLGMGGFTSTAPMLAGRMRGVPIFVHESNAIPGKANRLNAWIAQMVLLGFAKCARHFPRSTRCVTTGTPIRSSLLQAITRAEALQSFGFDPTLSQARTLLVMGGSQGAQGINHILKSVIPSWKGLPIRVIHITGMNNEAAVRTTYKENGIAAHVAAFCHEMQVAYAAADLAVARSGAASLCELSAWGVPAILIPYPFAAEDHQTRNAELFATQGAALLVKENAAASEVINRHVRELLFEDKEKLYQMATAMSGLARRDAAERVASIIETTHSSVRNTGEVAASLS